MIKKLAISFFSLGLLSGCSIFSDSDGQVVYHWQRYNTGVEKFSRDHAYCMRLAEPFRIMPRMETFWHDMMYTEEKKLEVRADWTADRGIWASYVPYPGAQPLIVNSLRNDKDASPRTYSSCMKDLGYTIRYTDIPEITNINLHQY